ncbi:hypothetical protein HN415_00210, partial [Candidatus Woesearchaeota archaeon]|nr:hypothetical protein [Candidatus Woesearchaeota archaeon]
MPSKPECRINQIVRDGYYRKAYTKKNGIHIKGKYIKQTCTKDMGKPGKTTKSKKVLPKVENKGFLTNQGYKESNSFKERKKALDKAIEQYGALKVQRHIGLIRNYAKGEPKRHKLLTKDFENVRSIRLKEKKMLNNEEKKTIKKNTVVINKPINTGNKTPKKSNNNGMNTNLIPKKS